MEKQLKTAILSFFRVEISKRFSSFSERKICEGARLAFGKSLLLMHAFEQEGREYFFALVSRRESRLFVVVGWKSRKDDFPPLHADQLSTVRVRPFDWLRASYATTLFWLCQDRGSAEVSWDLYTEENWVKDKESFPDYWRRVHRRAQEKHLEILSQGGANERFAAQQASLVGEDILACLQEYGVSFLQEAALEHAKGLKGGAP